MGKELVERGGSDLVQSPDHDLDHAEVLAQLLAQVGSQAGPVSGPEWATAVRPPAIPGTTQDRYARTVTPVRAVLMFGLWVTWDWKRGAAVLLFVLLLATLVVTR